MPGSTVCSFLLQPANSLFDFCGRPTAKGFRSFYNTERLPVFSQAPCILLLISDAGDYRYPEDRIVPFIEGAAAVQNIYLLYKTMGLGCCWGPYTSSGTVGREREVRNKLKIPDTHLIVVSLAIGKSSQFVCEIPRDLPENRFWNNYYGNK